MKIDKDPFLVELTFNQDHWLEQLTGQSCYVFSLVRRLRKEEEFQVIKSSILAILKIPVRHPMKNSSSEWSLNFRREFGRILVD